MSIKTEELIHELSQNLKPIKIVKFGLADVFKVFLIGIFCVISALALLGLRADFFNQALTLKYMIENILIIFTALISIVAAFSLSVPSRNNKNLFRTPILAGLIILGITLYSFFTTSYPLLYLGHGFACVAKLLLVGIVPATFLFHMIRHAAVLNRNLTSMFILASAISFGLLGVQLTCADSTPLHLLLWHIVPSVVIILSGLILGKFLFKKL